MRRLCVCILCCVLMLSMALTAYAAGNVTYYAEADEFVFAPGSNHSPTDLFSNLKGVMPGDTITDQIEIKNHSTRGAQIRLYLRSLGAQENTDAFLSQLTLTVKAKNGSLLFDAPADQTAQLTDWVYLGTIKPLGKTKLDLELQVPHTLGNEFQNEIAYIDWEFKIEEIPLTISPATGDNSNVVFFGGVLLLSTAALLILLIGRKRKKKEEQ